MNRLRFQHTIIVTFLDSVCTKRMQLHITCNAPTNATITIVTISRAERSSTMKSNHIRTICCGIATHFTGILPYTHNATNKLKGTPDIHLYIEKPGAMDREAKSQDVLRHIFSGLLRYDLKYYSIGLPIW